MIRNAPKKSNGSIILLCTLFLFPILSAYSREFRPAGNTGTGFFVKQGKIYDANGVEFIPMGYNSTVFWGGKGDCKKDNLQHTIPSTGANAVRLVTVTENQGNTWSWSANASVQRELVQLCVDNKIVPMLEMHDATCGDDIQPVFDYWLSDSMVQLCKDFEKYLIVNIANEHNFATPEDWRDDYISFIGQLRDKGVNNLIAVDAGKTCGQNPEGVLQYGQSILDGDPQNNVLLTIHFYGYWRTDTPESWQFRVQDELQTMRDSNLPVVVGEFGWDTPDGGTVPYDPRLVISTCENLGIGWYFWSFFDGTDKPFYNIITGVCNGYADQNDLTDAGKYIVPYLQSNAVTASVYETTSETAMPRCRNGDRDFLHFVTASNGRAVLSRVDGKLIVCDLAGRTLISSRVYKDKPVNISKRIPGQKIVVISLISNNTAVHSLSLDYQP